MASFQSLGLIAKLVDSVSSKGYTEATPIQAKAIPAILEGRDVMGGAQTGTGKTAAFGLPMIEKIDVKSKNVQGLVIAPTRELCVQISNDFKAFSKYIPKLNIATIYGGAG